MSDTWKAFQPQENSTRSQSGYSGKSRSPRTNKAQGQTTLPVNPPPRAGDGGPGQYLGEGSPPLRQLGLHLRESLRLPQGLLQLLLGQLQALLQLAVLVLSLWREQSASGQGLQPRPLLTNQQL